MNNITLTNDQQKALKNIKGFIEGDEDVFILKGYAGTGKTTLLSSIAKFARESRYQIELIAPTGRAAKILREKTNLKSSTVHSQIYNFDNLEEVEIGTEGDNNVSFVWQYALRKVNSSNVFYIVDEASMVSDKYSMGEFLRFGSGYLLRDLLTFTRAGNPAVNSKILFVGDPAQLPPVNMNFSPSLSKNYLREKYGLKVSSTEMKEVIRQDKGSKILDTSKMIRDVMESGVFNNFKIEPDRREVFKTTYNDFLPSYKAASDDKIIIAFKNATVKKFNGYIREDKYGKPDLPIQPGDKIVVGQNNQAYDVMNGDFGMVLNRGEKTVSRNVRFYTKGGKVKEIKLTWRKVSIDMTDIHGHKTPITALMLENFLNSEENHLSSLERRALYIDFKQRNPNLKPKTAAFNKALRNDHWFNALMIKYGYAVTCHKSQGGEWDNVFVIWEIGTNNKKQSASDTSGRTNSFFYRWSYTAVTRATETLNCINAPGYSPYSDMVFVPVELSDEIFKQDMPEQSSFKITSLDKTIEELLQKFKIDALPDSFRNHFIKLSHSASDKSVKISNYARKGYEIRYSFTREKDVAAIKFWVNGNDEFTGKWAHIPSQTNSESFHKEVSQIIEQAESSVIHLNQQNESKNGLNGLERFDFQHEFCEALFKVVKQHLKESKIHISDVAHLSYKERYSFNRGSEKATIDFEYNGKGRFGRVVPLPKKCNSSNLLNDLADMINSLKQL